MKIGATHTIDQWLGTLEDRLSCSRRVHVRK